jgi:hypothetical protein
MKRFVLLSLLTVATVLSAATAAHATPIVAADYQTQCVGQDANINGLLASQDATVMRISINPTTAGQGLDCVRGAYDAGYRVFLNLGFGVLWTPAQMAQWFASVLPQYAPYLWAVSVGSEQELQAMSISGYHGVGTVCSPQTTYTSTVANEMVSVRVKVKVRVRMRVRIGRKHHKRTVWRWRTVRRWRTASEFKPQTVNVPHTVQVCGPTTDYEDYRNDWDAVAPIIAQIAPQALRVYGEVSPWGFEYFKQSWFIDGGAPPLVNAIAMHCYDTQTGGMAEAPADAAWAADQGMPLWCTEMSPVFSPGADQPWINADTPQSWALKTATMEQAGPNIQLVSYFDGWNPTDGP